MWRRIAVVPVICMAVALSPLMASPRPAGGPDSDESAAPRIELAILLDTSNSMDGLINQAKTQLWKVVNEFATSKRDGKQPELHVALFEYGNDGLPADQGHIRLVLPLTNNLDQVSEELFKLTTNGGSEYCGQVIERATQTLKWSKSNRNLKCIFIAGNEPFTQGPVDFRKACQDAVNQGIIVNTIHCGDHQEGVSTMWAEGAKLADGSYMSINQNAVLPEIAAPQDEELARLSTELNSTYLAYGDLEERVLSVRRQEAQDANAFGAGAAVAASRAASKASPLYNNARWDLCDACRLGEIKLEDLKEEQLPEVLRKMTIEEHKAYVEQMNKRREKVQQQIKELSAQRDTYIAERRRAQAVEANQTLDFAIIDTVRKQAQQKDFQFEE